MPFGLTGAPGTFRRHINESLTEYLDAFCTAYPNDNQTYNHTKRERLEHLCLVLSALRKAGRHAKPAKCELLVEETKFPGLIVGTYGVRLDSNKVTTVANWETPKRLPVVQAFIGLGSF